LAFDSGVKKKPSVERGPKLMTAITQPHAINTAGVRQLTSLEGAVAVDIGFSGQRHAGAAQRRDHSHWPPAAKTKHRDGFDPCGAWLVETGTGETRAEVLYNLLGMRIRSSSNRRCDGSGTDGR